MEWNIQVPKELVKVTGSRCPVRFAMQSLSTEATRCLFEKLIDERYSRHDVGDMMIIAKVPVHHNTIAPLNHAILHLNQPLQAY